MPIVFLMLRKVLYGSLCLILVAVFSGCPVEIVSTSGQNEDLAAAAVAVTERDIGDAEMYYQRYLRKNPYGEKRWEVWQSLLRIALDIRHDKETAREYLEIMLEEFDQDSEKSREIQLALGSLSAELHLYERATTLLEDVSTDPGITPEVLAGVYRELSRIYLRRLEFSLSKEVLERCLQLEVAGETKARCMYALAEANMLTDELELAEKALREMLAQDFMNEGLRVEGIFMLADVLEQRERFEEAGRLFESIRDSHQNPRVIEVRLGALRNKRAKN